MCPPSSDLVSTCLWPRLPGGQRTGGLGHGAEPQGIRKALSTDSGCCSQSLLLPFLFSSLSSSWFHHYGEETIFFSPPFLDAHCLKRKDVIDLM